jgi:ABC-type nitrate/sulfonate/bicarbonate transport system substrate-binding protein
MGLACATLLGLSVAAPAAEPVPLTIVIFSAPSLGAFLPEIITKKSFDKANGLAIKFEARPPDAYATQFNSGEFEIGGSAAVLTVGLADNRGVKVSYLFNLFDYWGAVVTQRPGIKMLADLKDKELAAAKGTTNYSMFEWFARQKGLDTAALKIVNTATAGLVGYALADRADAVQLWEPAYSLLQAKRPEIRTLDLDIAGRWHAAGGGDHIPYLGVAAHQDWVAKHGDLIQPLYKTYAAAADFVRQNPAEAAAIIAGKGDATDRAALQKLIEDKERLGMNLAPAGAMTKDIQLVYRAGMSLGLLNAMPNDATIYQGALN